MSLRAHGGTPRDLMPPPEFAWATSDRWDEVRLCGGPNDGLRLRPGPASGLLHSCYFYVRYREEPYMYCVGQLSPS